MQAGSPQPIISHFSFHIPQLFCHQSPANTAPKFTDTSVGRVIDTACHQHKSFLYVRSARRQYPLLTTHSGGGAELAGRNESLRSPHVLPQAIFLWTPPSQRLARNICLAMGRSLYSLLSQTHTTHTRHRSRTRLRRQQHANKDNRGKGARK